MIRRLAVRVGLNCAVAGAALVASSLLATPALVQAPAVSAAPGTADTRAEREAARVSALLEDHDCWSDAAPVGSPEPHHAVVTRPDQRPRLVDASVGYAIWLEGRPGTLHGFCP
ncbi:hypothetical protein J2X46_003743 [Nocardioides sp. BE266]|uniref:hypothetical protein n=1 Tax=Nocardioides sp. BE266 TaxID=2817725 RepID=UPI002855ACA0|nr:hypothetical protein [Nocardioides sp. BE266]MDR7254745.1 hypothetical protein [Nocardioides sp. BE266]